MIIKSDYPVLEYSTNRDAVINPWRVSKKIPRLCLVTFFEEVLNDFVENVTHRLPPISK